MTDQSSEILVVGEEKLYISQVQPLETYFTDYETTPRKHWKLVPTFTCENRAYGGTWAIKNNALYLVNIYANRKKVTGFWFWKKVSFPEVGVIDLFPDAINGEVKATWFTGNFWAETKSMNNPVDDRLSLRIKNGVVEHHQWSHINPMNRNEGIVYDKPLPN